MATMTKMHFQLCADVLKQVSDKVARMPGGDKRAAAESTLQELADAFAHTFKQANPRFKSHVFYKACGTFFTDAEADAEWKRLEKKGSN